MSIVQLFTHAAFFLIAFIWALRRPAPAWRAVRWAALFIAVLCGLEIASGVLDIVTHGASRVVHRWLGVGLLASWWIIVAVVAICLALIRSRPRTAIASALLAVALAFAIFVESVCGYMLNTDAFSGPAGEETQTRFYVVHCVALPMAIGLCASSLVLLTLLHPKRPSELRAEITPIEFSTSENPYRSPKAG